ncbi:hypothetical protein IPJ72_05890 [Candidatus Peregrinibacteria bacterium]|nr:MAG: hypothetical protein IPJ72_05890 [Candidatus Peregrinibacteria bacterium]
MPYTPKQKVMLGAFVALVLLVGTLWAGLSLNVFKGDLLEVATEPKPQPMAEQPIVDSSLSQQTGGETKAPTSLEKPLPITTDPVQIQPQETIALNVIPREGGDSQVMQQAQAPSVPTLPEEDSALMAPNPNEPTDGPQNVSSQSSTAVGGSAATISTIGTARVVDKPKPLVGFDTPVEDEAAKTAVTTPSPRALVGFETPLEDAAALAAAEPEEEEVIPTDPAPVVSTPSVPAAPSTPAVTGGSSGSFGGTTSHSSSSAPAAASAVVEGEMTGADEEKMDDSAEMTKTSDVTETAVLLQNTGASAETADLSPNKPVIKLMTPTASVGGGVANASTDGAAKSNLTKSGPAQTVLLLMVSIALASYFLKEKPTAQVQS